MSIEERWIPTTTCMWPKREGVYLISIDKRFFDDGDEDRVKAVTYYIDPETKRKYWIQNIGSELGYYYEASEVTAWMPYPKPYKKGV